MEFFFVDGGSFLLMGGDDCTIRKEANTFRMAGISHKRHSGYDGSYGI